MSTTTTSFDWPVRRTFVDGASATEERPGGLEGPRPAGGRGSPASLPAIARLDDATTRAGALAPADLKGVESLSAMIPTCKPEHQRARARAVPTGDSTTPRTKADLPPPDKLQCQLHAYAAVNTDFRRVLRVPPNVAGRSRGHIASQSYAHFSLCVAEATAAEHSRERALTCLPPNGMTACSSKPK